MLAFGMNGAPLSHEYGGPLRLVVPYLQGYKSVKWLRRIHSYRHDPAGIKELLGQSKSGALGQAWMSRLDIKPSVRAAGEPTTP
jgi:DMSO/TMAO reductase YedYZ molybdopterin-dependent catalytic subunit